MFGRIMLEGMFGSEDAVSWEFAFALGRRLERRLQESPVRRRAFREANGGNWGVLRGWLLTDLPGEEPLPLRGGPQNAWQCNECGSDEFTGAVSEQDLKDLTCTACGANEFHKVAVGR